jgi:hypothetical protein
VTTWLTATAVAALLAASPSATQSQSLLANDYFEGCELAFGLGASGDSGALSAGQQFAVSACLGFVDGANSALTAIDAELVQTSGELLCADRRPSNFDALSIWVGYLQDYPIQLSADAFTSFLRAMQEAYPCP